MGRGRSPASHDVVGAGGSVSLPPSGRASRAGAAAGAAPCPPYFFPARLATNSLKDGGASCLRLHFARLHPLRLRQ